MINTSCLLQHGKNPLNIFVHKTIVWNTVLTTVDAWKRSDCNLLTFFCAWTSICFPSDLTLIVSLAISFTSKLNLNLSFSSVKKLLRVVSSILIRDPETPLRSRGISCCISTFSRPISTDICLFIFSISLSMSILSPPEPVIVVWKKIRKFKGSVEREGLRSQYKLTVFQNLTEQVIYAVEESGYICCNSEKQLVYFVIMDF